MKTSRIVSSTTRLLRAGLTLSAFAVGSVFAQTTYQVYTYSGTIGSTTSISDGAAGTINFTAGTPISGQIYVMNGVTNSTTWGWPGETGQYNGSVVSFTFDSTLFSTSGTGPGQSYVSDNRRFTQSAGSARQDNFLANVNTSFASTAVGGGVSSLDLNLSTNFGSNLSAISGTTLPTSLDVSLFDASHIVTLSFANSTSLVATLNSVSVSTVSAIPEPSTYAAIAGSAMLGLAVWRRSNRNKASAAAPAVATA